ncbi:MAG: DNA repair protein RadC [Bacilli bacterium]|nr:DNA repair protein RadC [Bacilli bacterium]
MNKVMMKDIPLLERPRERFIKYGAEYLSNEEILSIVLKTGSKSMNVKELSSNILKEVKDIRNLKDYPLNRLIKINGIKEVKAVTLLASIELGKRVYEEKDELYIRLDNSKKVYDYIKKDLINKKQEYFYSIYLDSKKNLIEKKLLFIGTLNKANVHPREIFKYACLLSSDSIVIVHNHPSNDVLPSKEDLILTKNLVDIGKTIGINVIDHIIVGNNNYYSFYENNDL